MFLNDLTQKNICVGDSVRGICKGVGVSLKTYNVKYLLCASSAFEAAHDFAVNISAVTNIGDTIQLSKLRSSFPKNCARIFPDIPVYSYDGGFLGKLQNIELENLTAISLTTHNGFVFPFSSVTACLDAVILKKEQPFPIGQRIPAPFVSKFSTQKNIQNTIVTKPLLRKAVEQGTLIKLTLSLSPFSLEVEKTKSPLNGIFRRNF